MRYVHRKNDIQLPVFFKSQHQLRILNAFPHAMLDGSSGFLEIKCVGFMRSPTSLSPEKFAGTLPLDQNSHATHCGGIQRGVKGNLLKGYSHFAVKLF